MACLDFYMKLKFFLMLSYLFFNPNGWAQNPSPYGILYMFQLNEDPCKCQFGANTKITFDSTKDKISPIVLDKGIKSGCGPKAVYLAVPGQTFSKRGVKITISSVEINHIKRSHTKPNYYEARLSVLSKNFNPISVPFIFEVDPKSVATKQAIRSCSPMLQSFGSSITKDETSGRKYEITDSGTAITCSLKERVLWKTKIEVMDDQSP